MWLQLIPLLRVSLSLLSLSRAPVLQKKDAKLDDADDGPDFDFGTASKSVGKEKEKRQGKKETKEAKEAREAAEREKAAQDAAEMEALMAELEAPEPVMAAC